ncbi:hypothetical protein BZA05DRAFT_2564 [Tricharina praecox]|uniref:uncharacterized protein n=1 Tax=Tricharina praecox TaxID=43433 RepID=UPI00221FB50F|nr:uncharacterized protein BZA05DRAFT_2564 [Tricharina praecox]KAI5858413.1 hypothetical protein BZA05DRAFT_2564 [Tricharina praecox]
MKLLAITLAALVSTVVAYPQATLIERSETTTSVTNPTPPKDTPIPSERIVTTYPCKIQGALYCWIDGKNMGSCNATEGFVTNDWFLPVKVGDWKCTPGQYLGVL